MRVWTRVKMKRKKCLTWVKKKKKWTRKEWRRMRVKMRRKRRRKRRCSKGKCLVCLTRLLRKTSKSSSLTRASRWSMSSWSKSKEGARDWPSWRWLIRRTSISWWVSTKKNIWADGWTSKRAMELPPGQNSPTKVVIKTETLSLSETCLSMWVKTNWEMCSRKSETSRLWD